MYTAKMKHDEATIIRLVETQANTFQFGKKLFHIALAMGLILIGLYVKGNYIMPMVCLLAGCMLITGLNVPSRVQAKKLCEQMGGQFPHSDYTFEKTGFRDGEKSSLTPYQKLIALVEDREYLYLYISKFSAYMVDKSTVSNQDVDGLKTFLAQKTGLDWRRPNTLMNFRFRSLFDLFKKKKSA